MELLRDVVMENPRLATSPCIQDCCLLPIHLLLMFGTAHGNQLQKLVQAASKSLTVRDPIYHFYPFLLAACHPRRIITDVVEDKQHIETIFFLLREAPWIIDVLLTNQLDSTH